MGKYIVDFNTGVAHELELDSLMEAKTYAIEQISYTQENVRIIDGATNEELTCAAWFGVEPTEEDEVLVHIGNGFYARWTDEIENM